jgi:hypothetical protein
VPEPLPEIRALTESRWEATCGKCLRHSVPVPATSPENAWATLKALGWSYYVSKYGGRGYALCKTCTQSPPDSDADAREVRRKRKRR